ADPAYVKRAVRKSLTAGPLLGAAVALALIAAAAWWRLSPFVMALGGTMALRSFLAWRDAKPALRLLATDGPEAQRFVAMRMIGAASMNGVRPRDWDKGWFAPFKEGPPSPNRAILLTEAVARAIDANDPETEEVLTRALALADQMVPPVLFGLHA